MSAIELVVTEIRQRAHSVREVVLAGPGGADLPPWGPGDHIQVEIEQDGSTGPRAFSLVGEAPEGSCRHYRIAVEGRREQNGLTKRFYESVKAGTRLRAGAPRSEFVIRTHKADRLLVAGGIGVAPLISMAHFLRHQALDFRFFYLGTRQAELGYLDELEALCGEALQVRCGAGLAPDLAAAIEALGYPAEIYVCGSRPLVQAVTAVALENGLSRMQIVEQCFDPPPPPPESTQIGFEVELVRSGMLIDVPADATILDTLLSEGVPARFYCGRGECGFCRMPVLAADGDIDHRDHVLPPEARNTQMCICVSRLKSGSRLKLDL